MTWPLLTVYHDGSCPVCRLEIGHYRAQRGANEIEWIDVSAPSAMPGLDLSREDAMKRFHVRLPSGELRSGAAAFAEIWNVLPLYRPLAFMAQLPGATLLFEAGYRAMQPARPVAARFLKHVM